MVAAPLEAGADPMEFDRPGRTALRGAARGGDQESMALLLAAGSDPSPAQKRGFPPLVYAFVGDEDGSFACAKMLLAAVADPEGRDQRGRAPLREMPSKARLDPCAILVQAGARWEPLSGEGPAGLSGLSA